MTTTTLWRPTGPAELDLVRELNCAPGPPGCPNSRSSTRSSPRSTRSGSPGTGTSHTTAPAASPGSRLNPTSWPDTPSGRPAAGRSSKLWVPAEELEEFNAHLVGEIQIVHEFHPTA